MKVRTLVSATGCLLLGLALSGCGGSDKSASDSKPEPEKSAAPPAPSATPAPAPAAAHPAEPHFVVAVGASGRAATNHDIALDALRSGRTQFTVAAGPTVYTIELTPEQVADVLKGSAVILQGKAGDAVETIRLAFHSHGAPAGASEGG